MSKNVQPITKEFTLSCPISVADGTVLEKLKVREPVVKDFRIASQQAKEVVEREVIIVARCTDLQLEDLDALKWKDYQKIQQFLFGDDDNGQSDTE